MLQFLAHGETVDDVLQHDLAAGGLVHRVDENRAQAEDALQQRARDRDVDDAEQLDGVEALMQQTALRGQLVGRQSVRGERERGAAPVALALRPDDVAVCDVLGHDRSPPAVDDGMLPS